MIASPLKIALSHDSLVVGALEANRTRLLARVDEARGAGADLVVFPELATLGYPPRDLLHLPGQVEGNLETVEALRRASDGIGILVGHVARREEGHGPSLWNAASLLVDGEVVHRWIKALLPTYDVFDEARYFSAGTSTAVVDFRGHRLGVSICEDMWAELQGGDDDRYARSPIDEQIAMGAELLINVSASPYEHGKAARRHEAVARLARRGGCPMSYVNQVGGQDELLFDGASFAMDPHGRLVWSYPSFEEGLGMVELPLDGQEKLPPPPDDISTVCDALVMGLRDYMTKCGFGSAVVGLSGGVDSSALLALMAELNENPVQAFTAGFVGTSVPDERARARELAAVTGAEMHDLAIDADTFWRELPRIAAAMDDPTAETSASVDANGAVVLVFEVPAGEYAIASFWDENDNGELDTRLFGIPKERVGMSNNAKGRMGPAKWKDAKFTVEAGTTAMSIDLIDAT